MKRVAARDEGSRHLWKALMRRYRPGRHCRLRKRFPLAGIIAWRHPRSRARVAILQRGGGRPIPGIHVFINFSHSSLNRSSIRIVYANHPSAWWTTPWNSCSRNTNNNGCKCTKRKRQMQQEREERIDWYIVREQRERKGWSRVFSFSISTGNVGAPPLSMMIKGRGSPDIGGPRFNAAETAPETRLYFVPSISPLSLTAPGEKEADNVTSHWSQFGEKFPMKFILCRDNLFSYNDRIYRQDRVAIHYIYIYIHRESFNNWTHLGKCRGSLLYRSSGISV